MINIIKLLKVWNLDAVQMGVVRKWQFNTPGGVTNLGVSMSYPNTVEVEFICWELCT